MYRIPNDLDLSKVVGEFITQVRVGQFDLQFTLGDVNFVIQSAVNLILNGEIIGKWEEGKWPDSKFFEIMNVNVVKYEIPNDRLIILHFENGIEMHLMDSSDQYECMLIIIESDTWII